jgi:uncharacterized protein YbcI
MVDADIPFPTHLDDATSRENGQGSLLAQVSDAMVRLYKEQFGRGPTKVRSAWAGPNTLVVLLEDTFTPVEKSLVAMGEQHRLRDTRMFFQYATETEFRRIVEELVGRKVHAFISGLDVGVDIAVELFTFHPQG